MNAEQWRVVPGFPDYEVSDLGRVRSNRWSKSRILKCKPGNRGYCVATIYDRDGAMIKRSVHVLVLLAFVGPRPVGATDIRHLNGNKVDNRLENLAYGTRSENERDKQRHGGHYLRRRTHCVHGHPLSGDNLRVDVNGHRRCRTCATVGHRLAYLSARDGVSRVDLGTYFAQQRESA